MQVPEEAFRAALSRLVVEIPLGLRAAHAPLRVVPATAGDGALADSALQRGLRLDYGRWCQRQESPGDCFSLLRDGLHMDARDRLTLALGFSLDTVWDGAAVAVEEHLGAAALKAMVAGFLASYVLMLAAPEPVLTKSVAVVLTGYLLAYLGLGPLWTLIDASRELVAASETATTFAALEEAGHRFGRVLGENGARIVILAATAGLGGRAALLSKGPTLPGFTQAALQAEGQVGLRLLALSEVRSMAITSASGLVVRLSSTAVAATGMGSDGGRPLAGGKHSGFLRNYQGRPPEELRKGITSLKKQIAEHQDKIAHPERHIPDWSSLDPRQRDALVNKKWPSDIQRQTEQLDILEALLKRVEGAGPP